MVELLPGALLVPPEELPGAVVTPVPLLPVELLPGAVVVPLEEPPGTLVVPPEELLPGAVVTPVPLLPVELLPGAVVTPVPPEEVFPPVEELPVLLPGVSDVTPGLVVVLSFVVLPGLVVPELFALVGLVAAVLS